MHPMLAEDGLRPLSPPPCDQYRPRLVGFCGVAIVGGHDDTAEAKKQIMRDCGIHVVDSPAQIGTKMAEVIGVTA